MNFSPPNWALGLGIIGWWLLFLAIVRFLIGRLDRGEKPDPSPNAPSQPASSIELEAELIAKDDPLGPTT